MNLLVSIINFAEAGAAACVDGIDILDVKNPSEGSLGCSFPHVVSGVVKGYGKRFPISAAAGDMLNTPGMASMVARGITNCGVDYIKVGLLGSRNIDDAVFLLRAMKDAVVVNPFTKIIVVGYADYLSLGTLSPRKILEAAMLSEINGVMLDTYIKDGKNLFDHLEISEVEGFVGKARDKGFLTALAGSLGLVHLELLSRINPDIIGVRSAVCENLNRGKAVDPRRIAEFAAKVKSLGYPQVAS